MQAVNADFDKLLTSFSAVKRIFIFAGAGKASPGNAPSRGRRGIASSFLVPSKQYVPHFAQWSDRRPAESARGRDLILEQAARIRLWDPVPSRQCPGSSWQQCVYFGFLELELYFELGLEKLLPRIRFERAPLISTLRHLFSGFLRGSAAYGMKYNWHRIAENGPLPLRFHHALVSIREDSTSITKVYAVGREDGGCTDLEVFELDSKLENWNKLPVFYENEMVQKSVRSKRHGHALAAVKNAIYVIRGMQNSDVGEVLKFDTVERKWSMLSLIGGPVDVSSLTSMAIVEKIVLFGGCKSNELANDMHILDTVNKLWISPKVLGEPPAPRSGYSVVLLGKERLLVYGGSSDREIWFLEIDTPYVRAQRKAGDEVVAWSKGRRGIVPVVICGPSGVGKGTLITKLMKEFPDRFGFSVSHTTRMPREKESDGVHYHFTNRNAMELAVKEGKFLEHANVHGNLYGTSISAVEAVADAGKCCILDIDVQGAQSVKKSCMQALFLFITPPSFEELERRLRGRGTETEEQVQKRLETAKKELELGKSASLFDHVLVNDDLESTYRQLKALLGLSTEYPENGFAVPASSKLVKIEKPGHYSNDLYIVDASTMVGGAPEETQGLKWLRLEPSNKQVPCEYTNTVNLSDLEILMTGDHADSILVKLAK